MHGDPNFLAGGLAGRERNCRRGNVRFNLVELGIGAFDFGAAIVRPCLEGATAAVLHAEMGTKLQD
jgi:hypothetical protein